MVYISIIDELGLDIDAISNIDSNTIIRLHKQLKAKAVLDKQKNLGEIANLVEALKDEQILKNHIFIEKHPWIKQLIQGNIKDMQSGHIRMAVPEVEEIEELRSFLAPYLKVHIKPFLTENLRLGNHELILRVLKHNYLFSEDVNQIIINFYRAKLNFAIVYISEGKIRDKEYPVGYIANQTFIKCLNEFPNSFSLEINALNSEIIDLYNANRKKTTNRIFLFAAKAMVAFGLLDVSNEFLKDMLISNANIAREWTLPSRRRQSSSGFSWWTIIFIIFILIKIIGFFGKSSSSPYRGNTTFGSVNVQYDDNIQRLFEMKRTKPFVETNVIDVPLEKYDNPYSPEFYRFYPPQDSTDISRAMTYIKNKTGKELILFVLYKNVDKSVYIPENDSIVIQLQETDTLVFYSGRQFARRFASNERFFKEAPQMSDLYTIDSISFETEHFIDVLPQTNVTQSTSSPQKSKDSLDFRGIGFQKMNLETIMVLRYFSKD